MAMSDKTRERIGLEPRNDLESALGVKSHVTVVKSEETALSKAEQKLLRSNALDVDDSDIFTAIANDTGRGSEIIAPTYAPIQLHTAAVQNNTLMQCVATMEVNIDGTGYEIERADGENVTDADSIIDREIKPFFDEPWPETSFITIRRQLRRDLETTGNAYLEVLRDAGGRIQLLKRMDAKLTRMLKLDDPVPVDVKIKRGDSEATMRVMKRERRFAMVVGKKLVYFKEFNASRELNKKNGRWEDDPQNRNEPMTEQNKATEVIHFTVQEDVLTPYGVPRWINQTPSVVGSRKAEEYNVEFFNHGGVPPAAIFIAGGSLTATSRDTITAWMGGKAALKQRAVLVEIMSAGGDFNSTNNVRVTTERFGDSRQDDSMFENYDKRCALRIRGSFRLPPILVGLTEDYTRATAYVSTMVAESQIFQPERDEFDEIINRKLMREMWPDYRYRSLPVSINDIEEQIKALTLASTHVKSDNFVAQIAEVAHLELIPKDEEDFEEEFERQQKILASTNSMRAGQDVETRDEGGDGGASKEPGN